MCNALYKFKTYLLTMSLRCGGIRNDHNVANFVPSLAVKEF